MDAEKVAVWMVIKFPNFLKKLRGFFGCMNYYRRFIKEFSHISLPMTKMLKRGKEVKTSPRDEERFLELKKRLVEAPILVTPDWTKEFQVYVGVPGFCIGEVLSLLDANGRDHLIYFASKLLALAERNYSPTNIEALGIIYACRKFRHYLLGYKMIFHTNQNTLKYIMNKPNIIGRVSR